MKMRLEWVRDLDPAGYRIIEKKPRARKAGGSEPTLWIEGVGEGQSIIIKDRLEIEGLLRRLARVHDGARWRPRPANAEGALDFVKRYGFLRDPNGPETVDFIAGHILAAQKLFPLIHHKKHRAVERWTEANFSNIHLHPNFNYYEAEDESVLFFHPVSLIDAIYLQALQDVAESAIFEKCDRWGCPEWFKVGPGTGHKNIDRGGPRFCSPKCQKADQWRKLKLKKGVST